MPALRKVVDLILYSNLWIAAAAAGMTAQSQWLLFRSNDWDPLLGFVFFATLSLYAAHRLIGLARVPYGEGGRFEVIRRYRRPIAAVGVLSGLAAGFFFWQTGPGLWPWVLPPAGLALLYVLPLFRGRRLRDLHYIKIFLIAGAWTWVTVVLPAVRQHWVLTLPTLLMAAERAFFIFAITLPFDIRDLAIDAQADVRTLPARLGLPRTRALAGLALAGMMGAAYLNTRLEAYAWPAFWALGLTALAALCCVFLADRERHDYFYSGLVDGLMVAQFALVWCLA